MTGEIGVLIQNGEQIGGFYNWSAGLDLESSKDSDKRTQLKFQQFRIISNEVWLLKYPEGEDMTVRLYQYVNEQLVIIQERTGKVDIPRFPLNTTCKYPLEIVWTN